MWSRIGNEHIKYNNDQLETEILLNWTRIIFLDGPTRSGKTFFLNHMKSEGVLVIPFCLVQEELYKCLKEKETLNVFYERIDLNFPSKILAIEDIDISLRGRSGTQQVIAYLLKKLCQSRRIVLTGISINKQCGDLLLSLGSDNYEYFRYVE